MTRLVKQSQWYVRGKHVYHVTRTNIAGCMTVCGVKLVRGQDLEVTRPPLHQLCPECGGGLRR